MAYNSNKSPVEAWLSNSRKWVNTLPLKYLWTIQFDKNLLTNIGSNIKMIMDACEDGDGDKSGKWGIRNLNSAQDDNYGFLYVDGVSLNNETVEVSRAEIGDQGSRGGIVPGQYSGNRTPPQTVGVQFYETNVDFLDYFIRPWITAISYYGLIASDVRLKCNFSVTLYSNVFRENRIGTGPGVENEILTGWDERKTFKFFDAFPTTMDIDTLKYDGTSSSNAFLKNVTFDYRYYQVSVPDNTKIPGVIV